jgi:TonB family protein
MAALVALPALAAAQGGGLQRAAPDTGRFICTAVTATFRRGNIDAEGASDPAVRPLGPDVTCEQLYPVMSLRLGEAGTVTFGVTISSDGRARRVEMYRSSGRTRLDEGARDLALTRWTYIAAMRNGEAVDAEGWLDVTFAVGFETQ